MSNSNKEQLFETVKQQQTQDRKEGISRPAGYFSNRVITSRNRGVQHQFANSIGGCSSNYR